MNKFVLNFESNGSMILEKVEDGIKILFQATHFGEEIKITSMNVILTPNEGKEILSWLQEYYNELQ